MANYEATTRTNYFRVTDSSRLEAILNNTASEAGAPELWTMEKDGETLYAFGVYALIDGLLCENEDDCSYDLFIDELQKIVAPGDAIIITEIGHEKLRYISADAIIITADKVACVDLIETAFDEALKALGNPDYSTRMDY